METAVLVIPEDSRAVGGGVLSVAEGHTAETVVTDYLKAEFERVKATLAKEYPERGYSLDGIRIAGLRMVNGLSRGVAYMRVRTSGPDAKIPEFVLTYEFREVEVLRLCL